MWQPFETAPKDVEILLYIPTDRRQQFQVGCYRKIANGYGLFIGHIFGFDSEKPTHWHPLPEKPEQ